MSSTTLISTGATENVACAHCSLPVPAGLVEENATEQFCCNGCRGVYQLLHDRGLGGFYDGLDDEQQMAPVRPTGRSYATYDDPKFQELHAKPVQGGLARVHLYLEGIHCAASYGAVRPRTAASGSAALAFQRASVDGAPPPAAAAR